MVRNTVLLQATKAEKEGEYRCVVKCSPTSPTAAPIYPPRVPRIWADIFMKRTRHIELPCHKGIFRGLENVDRANALAIAVLPRLEADPSQILASVAELQELLTAIKLSNFVDES
eukprot:GHVN01098662.1.p1 GENE.GHVN01098662.1~~GHVN01098662.1.p1  ORF type:complete len:115 (-),score=6.41 GHVN01098662.1:146-490(-)